MTLKKRLNWKPDSKNPVIADLNYNLIESLHPLLRLASPGAILHADLRPLNPPIFDQGDYGSCTGNAWCRLLEFIELMLIRQNLSGPEEFDKIYHHLSRLFLYWNERRQNGDTNADDGAQLRDGMIAIKTWGVCEELLWPYNQGDLLSQPSPVCYTQAAQHKISNGYKIADGNLQEMKTCLLNGFPFVFGIMVYDSFMSDQVAANGMVPMPQANESIQGGHAICCVGFDDRHKHFICANSWGTSWGDKGYFYLPYDYVSNIGLSSDFWTVRI